MILFLVDKNLRQYYGSPLLQGSLLHLLVESAASNNDMHPTANSAALIRETRVLVYS